ncbi:MAG: hypothetical protein QG655_2684 [Actinomycetota bacterium]|jgi:hypothetical protein|nr:hypothetical protein [Actinomycetota bacterium]HPY22988.1 hypothetical protein [Mycobacterium sp.]
MTTALIIGGLVLVGLGLVASQLIRLKDWLDRQPPVPPPPAPDAPEDARPDDEP